MGGFGRALAGGVLGGFLGSLLFRGVAGADGVSGAAGAGFGLLDLLLLGGLGYAVYWAVRRNRTQAAPAAGYLGGGAASPGTVMEPSFGQAEGPRAGEDALRGVQHIRQMDPDFDLPAFIEWATDAFFQIQAGWMHRQVERLRPLLSDEMVGEFRALMDEARAAGRINRLENITVRSVEAVAAWQEQGKDYVTVRYRANLLDYMVDERSGTVVQGDDSTPVKFEECWTWVRPVGSGPWRLAAIQQAG